MANYDAWLQNSRDYEIYAGFERSDMPYDLNIMHGDLADDNKWDDICVFDSLEEAIDRCDFMRDKGFACSVTNKRGELVYPSSMVTR